MEELYSYMDTKLIKLNFVHPIEEGSIERTNKIEIEKKEYIDKEPSIIVTSYDKLIHVSTKDIVLDIEFKSEFLDKKNMFDSAKMDKELESYLSRSALSESSLLIGLVTSKAFGIPAIFPPIVMSELDEE